MLNSTIETPDVQASDAINFVNKGLFLLLREVHGIEDTRLWTAFEGTYNKEKERWFAGEQVNMVPFREDYYNKPSEGSIGMNHDIYHKRFPDLCGRKNNVWHVHKDPDHFRAETGMIAKPGIEHPIYPWEFDIDPTHRFTEVHPLVIAEIRKARSIVLGGRKPRHRPKFECPIHGKLVDCKNEIAVYCYEMYGACFWCLDSAFLQPVFEKIPTFKR